MIFFSLGKVDACCLHRMNHLQRPKSCLLCLLSPYSFSRKNTMYLHKVYLSSCFHLRRKKSDKQLTNGAYEQLPRPVSTLLKGLIRWLVRIHYNPKAITKTEYSTLILNKREPVVAACKFVVIHLNTGSLLFNIRVEHSVFVIAFGL